MKSKIRWGTMFLLLLCGGCLNTFYPIFTEKDLVTNRKLLGSWKEGEEKMIIENAPADPGLPPGLMNVSGKMMIIRTLDEMGEEAARDLAFLVKIGDFYFMDRFPSYTPSDLTLNSIYASMFIRQHVIYRVDAEGDTLRLHRVSDKRIKEEIEKKEIKIKMVKREDGNIIMASTGDLQNHIRKYASDPVFYEKDGTKTYTRIQ